VLEINVDISFILEYLQNLISSLPVPLYSGRKMTSI